MEYGFWRVWSPLVYARQRRSDIRCTAYASGDHTPQFRNHGAHWYCRTLSRSSLWNSPHKKSNDNLLRMQQMELHGSLIQEIGYILDPLNTRPTFFALLLCRQLSGCNTLQNIPGQTLPLSKTILRFKETLFDKSTVYRQNSLSNVIYRVNPNLSLSFVHYTRTKRLSLAAFAVCVLTNTVL